MAVCSDSLIGGAFLQPPSASAMYTPCLSLNLSQHRSGYKCNPPGILAQEIRLKMNNHTTPSISKFVSKHLHLNPVHKEYECIFTYNNIQEWKTV